MKYTIATKNGLTIQVMPATDLAALAQQQMRKISADTEMGFIGVIIREKQYYAMTNAGVGIKSALADALTIESWWDGEMWNETKFTVIGVPR